MGFANRMLLHALDCCWSTGSRQLRARSENRRGGAAGRAPVAGRHSFATPVRQCACSRLDRRHADRQQRAAAHSTAAAAAPDRKCAAAVDIAFSGPRRPDGVPAALLRYGGGTRRRARGGGVLGRDAVARLLGDGSLGHEQADAEGWAQQAHGGNARGLRWHGLLGGCRPSHLHGLRCWGRTGQGTACLPLAKCRAPPAARRPLARQARPIPQAAPPPPPAPARPPTQGLQANRTAGADSTIEVVLERAIYDAGLISACNFGDFRKLKWNRSSRTDKGVHSLCTVRCSPGDERAAAGLPTRRHAHGPAATAQRAAARHRGECDGAGARLPTSDLQAWWQPRTTPDQRCAALLLRPSGDRPAHPGG